jgi:excisionase family DNA binding protein
MCGTNFKPRSGSQKYCCEECATSAKESRKKRQRDFLRAVEPVIDVCQQEYLTFSKAAVLMGCSRQYIYKLVAQGKLPASRLSSRMALVRKSDIEKLLDASPYERVLPTAKPKAKVKTPAKPATPIEEQIEYYSGDDIISIYKVKQSWLYTAPKRNHIPTCRIAGKVYFSKRHVDEHFGTAVDLSTITEWLTGKEIAEMYGMGSSAVTAYVHRHRIPSKREFGQTYYSKSHFDELRRIDLTSDSRYCTVDDIHEKYGLSKANIQHIVKVNGVRKVKVGVKNLLLIEDVERVMAERAAQGL